MAAGACAGAAPDPASPGAAVRRDQPLELRLTSLEGRSLRLSQLRGRPVLLFMFATYDPNTQLALRPLMAAASRAEDVTLIGVAIQPDADEFLLPFRDALDVRFALYFEPSSEVLQGKTALGALPAVPAYIGLDERGLIRSGFFGPATADQISQVIDRVR